MEHLIYDDLKINATQTLNKWNIIIKILFHPSEIIQSQSIFLYIRHAYFFLNVITTDVKTCFRKFIFKLILKYETTRSLSLNDNSSSENQGITSAIKMKDRHEKQRIDFIFTHLFNLLSSSYYICWSVLVQRVIASFWMHSCAARQCLT